MTEQEQLSAAHTDIKEKYAALKRSHEELHINNSRVRVNKN